MTFELALAAMVLVQTTLCLLHSLGTRTAAETWYLLAVGVGFGYLFPAIEINLMTLYTFHGKLTVLGMPVHLGFAWYSLLYLALCLAELLGPPRPERGDEPWKPALVCGLVFGLMEAQFDPTLIALGIISFDVPSFTTYPESFNHGIPIFHVYLGFAFAYLFFTLGDRGRERRLTVYALSLGSMLLFPIATLGGVPLMEPVYRWVGARLNHRTLVVVDTIHFVTSFAFAGWVFAWWVRFAARKFLVLPKEASG